MILTNAVFGGIIVYGAIDDVPAKRLEPVAERLFAGALEGR